MTRPAQGKLKLNPEYRLVLTLSEGVIVQHGFDSLREAEDAALRLVRRSSHAGWVIERRLVSEWLAMPTPAAVQYRLGVPRADDGNERQEVGGSEHADSDRASSDP